MVKLTTVAQYLDRGAQEAQAKSCQMRHGCTSPRQVWVGSFMGVPAFRYNVRRPPVCSPPPPLAAAGVQ
jgi:hypothetical protein